MFDRIEITPKHRYARPSRFSWMQRRFAHFERAMYHIDGGTVPGRSRDYDGRWKLQNEIKSLPIIGAGHLQLMVGCREYHLDRAWSLQYWVWSLTWQWKTTYYRFWSSRERRARCDVPRFAKFKQRPHQSSDCTIKSMQKYEKKPST